jgi:membrane protein
MSEFPYAPTLIAKGRAHALYYARGLYKEIAAKNLFLWAQAIAFKVLVTVVPIVILATGLAGRLLRGEDAFAAVARFINDFLPQNQSAQVVDFLHQLQMASSTIVGIGGIGLFLSAVSLFITLRIAVGNAFEQDWHEGRSVIGGYLFDVRMVLQVGVLFLITIGMSVFVQSIEGPGILAFAGLDQPWVREGWQRAIQTMGLFVPFFITTAMFFQLYYLVPKPHPRKRSAFSGAIIAGVLWEMAKQIFTYYATYVGQFERYATEGLGAIGNTFALIIAFVFWVYFSGIVLMLGAVVASLREHRHVTSGLLPGEPPDHLPEVSPAQPPGDRSGNGSGGTRSSGTGSSSDGSAASAAVSEPSDIKPSPARRPDTALAPAPSATTRDEAQEEIGHDTQDDAQENFQYDDPDTTQDTGPDMTLRASGDTTADAPGDTTADATSDNADCAPDDEGNESTPPPAAESSTAESPAAESPAAEGDADENRASDHGATGGTDADRTAAGDGAAETKSGHATP